MFRLLHSILLGAALLTASACVAPQSLEIQLYSGNTRQLLGDRAFYPPSVRDALDGAEELTGYELVPVRNAPLIVEIVSVNATRTGRYWRHSLCHSFLRSVPEGWILAHEIGHAFGLGHSNDPENIMYKSAPETGRFTAAQKRRMARRARTLEALCFENSDLDAKMHDEYPALDECSIKRKSIRYEE